VEAALLSVYAIGWQMCRCARFSATRQVDSEAADFLEGASRVSVLGLGVADLRVYALESVEDDRDTNAVFPQFRIKALLDILAKAVSIVVQNHVHLTVRPSAGDAGSPI
jgi:hypothetical protein